MYRLSFCLRIFWMALAAALLTPAPALASNTSVTLEQAVADAVAHGFRGSILAARGERVLLEKSFTPGGNIQQSFRFASITKQMTAIMVMQEVESGRLKLDRTLGAYWPDYPNPQVRAITLRQLLMHYSGLANAEAGFHMQNAHNGDNMQAFATGICARPVQRAAGKEFDYNNCDYLVLGALLEKLNKQTYASLLRQRIYAPAAMRHAGYYSAALQDAPGHLHGTLGGQPEPAVNFASYGAAGSAFGNMRDLLAFDRAFIQGKYLSAASRAEMVKPNAVGGALGVWAYPFRGGARPAPVTIVERQGWIAGLRILNLIDLHSENVLIVVSTNGDLDLSQTWANKGLGADLLRALLNEK